MDKASEHFINHLKYLAQAKYERAIKEIDQAAAEIERLEAVLKAKESEVEAK